MTTEDCAYVRGKATVIAINDAVRLAPWADVLCSNDRGWWTAHKLMPDFAGLRVKICTAEWKRSDTSVYPRLEGGLVILKNTGATGLELDPSACRHYQNSGGAAINLAVHLGAKRIVLLGYDMAANKRNVSHFCDEKPFAVRSPYLKFRRLIATTVQPLAQAGVSVVNCTPGSALECFPHGVLREVLC